MTLRVATWIVSSVAALSGVAVSVGLSLVLVALGMFGSGPPKSAIPLILVIGGVVAVAPLATALAAELVARKRLQTSTSVVTLRVLAIVLGAIPIVGLLSLLVLMNTPRSTPDLPTQPPLYMEDGSGGASSSTQQF